MTDPISLIESRLHAAGKKVKRTGDILHAQCPAHEDKNPSLSIGLGTRGRDVVMHCHTGCKPDDVLGALGLQWIDFGTSNPRDAPLSEWVYRDACAKPVYKVVKRTGKKFHQQALNRATGEWENSLHGVERLPYRLPELLKAIEVGDTIWIAEGEKDVDALVDHGVAATCNSGGAGKFAKSLAEHFRGAREVIIVADRDEPGELHAADVSDKLASVGVEARIVQAADGKDAYDHFALGHDIDQFVPVGTPLSLESESFHPVDLGPVLAGEVLQPTPSILRRDDGQCLFYAGQINGIHGDSGTGKGWVALTAVTQQIRSGRTVVMVDTEDVAQSIVSRLRILGAYDDEIRDRFIYIRPTDPFGRYNVDYLIEVAVERHASLVILDSIGECFGLDGIDENKDAEVGPWLRAVARRIADAGPAVLLVDHSTKANDNPLHPSGSKRKRAAVGGASYLVTATKPLVAGSGGRLSLQCAKDRHGTYGRGEHVADLVMRTDIGITQVGVYAPEPVDDASLPILLAARAAVVVCRDEGAPLTSKAVLEMMKVKCKTDTKRAGLDLAVTRGALSEDAGPRNSRVFTFVKDMPEAPE